jgi:hypothetical protein
MSITTAQTGVDQGSSRGAEAVSPPLASPAPRANGSPPKAKQQSRPVQFPLQLKLNITLAMEASLQRLTRRLRLPAGVLGRLALMQYLAQQDREYHED